MIRIGLMTLVVSMMIMMMMMDRISQEVHNPFPPPPHLSYIPGDHQCIWYIRESKRYTECRICSFHFKGWLWLVAIGCSVHEMNVPPRHTYTVTCPAQHSSSLPASISCCYTEPDDDNFDFLRCLSFAFASTQCFLSLHIISYKFSLVSQDYEAMKMMLKPWNTEYIEQRIKDNCSIFLFISLLCFLPLWLL